MEERSRMRKGREHPAERDPTNDDDEDVHMMIMLTMMIKMKMFMMIMLMMMAKMMAILNTRGI